jgi:hypothetical protein
MILVTTGDQVDTLITHILTGIAGSGGTTTGAIGRVCRVASQSPVPESEISTLISKH